MMRKSMIAAVAVLGLSVSACQTSQVGTTVGGLLGAAGGGFAANKFIGKGNGKKLATAGGVLGGGLLGGLFGNSLGMPYDNRSAINNNAYMINSNGQRIDQNSNKIYELNGRQYQRNYDGTMTPIIINGQTGQQNNSSNYNCKVVNNYVNCNSN